jgi:hypothetical protein
MRFDLLLFSVLPLLAASLPLPGVLAGITGEKTALKVKSSA